MSNSVKDVSGVSVLVCGVEGEKLGSEQDVVDLVGEAWGEGAEVVVVPVERLREGFFELKTRMAGLFVQKFVNYRMRLVVVGDVSGYAEGSGALRDYIYETNKGRDVWFLKSMEEMEERLRGGMVELWGMEWV